MNKPFMWRKLFLIFSSLGLLNIALAYGIFYYSSISVLEERTGQQMASVRKMASQKLQYYLETLKIHAQSEATTTSTLDDVLLDKYILELSEKRDLPFYNKLKPSKFYPYQSDKLILKTKSANQNIIWVFEGSGLDKVLSEREGLGQTGEIYLVGHDRKIKSASRHLKQWKNIRVDNESIRLGRLDQDGVHSVKDYRGVEVVSSFSAFDYDGLNFVLLSEIDKAEVFSPLRSMFPKIFLICGFLLALTLISAYIFSSKILRLFENMKARLNDLNMNFIGTLEEEKKIISLNLHDGVGQLLTALKWGLSRNENPEHLIKFCNDAFAEIRTISESLMPIGLTEIGFFKIVGQFLRKQEEYYKVSINYWFSEPLEQLQFRDTFEVNLYRVIQELFQNTVKHGNARTVSLTILKEDDFLKLRYEDDGSGMPDAAPMPRILLYRTELMEAIISRSKTKVGLEFLIQVPIKKVFL